MIQGLRATAVALLGWVGAAGAIAEPIPTPPAAPEGAAPASLLPELVEAARRTARIENGRLVGDGADLLRRLGAESHFVMLGEEHGSEGIANFATAYWRDLHNAGYRYAAIETDPYVAHVMERELRRGGVAAWRDFAAAHGGAPSAPFFTWTAEADYAAAVVRDSPAQPALWGLDQVFVGAAPWLLADIAARARNRETRALAQQLAGEAASRFAWLGSADEAALRRLRALMTGRDAQFAPLLDDMILSNEIYRPYLGSGGEYWISNTARENLMRRNFVSAYLQAERRDGAPRVFLKFGANHAFRGASPLSVQGLGGFVNEFAAARGQSALTVLALCGPGSEVSGQASPPVPCGPRYGETWAFLSAATHPTEISVFDVRMMRLRQRRWAHLPVEAQRVLGSFDIIVVVPNTPAARYFDGMSWPADAR